MSNPLAIQELIDYCIDFLYASAADLKRCALVSRYWTHTAQMHLFKQHVVIGSPGYSYGDSTFLAMARQRCRLLYGVLAASPGLLGFVEALKIHLDTTPPDTLRDFATLELPSLRRIVVFGNWMPAAGTIIEEFLGRGTLTTISISGNFSSLSAFTRILTRCSTSITDVSFCNVRVPTTGIHPSVGNDLPDRRIEIHALDLWWSSGIHEWLNSPHCCFEFSNLKRLRLNENITLPQWVAFAPSIPRIEYLQFQPQITGVKVDLAPFSKLKRIEALIEFRDDISAALETLSTLTRPNQIEMIRFRLTHSSLPDLDSGAAIDKRLTALPIPNLRAVELVYLSSPSTNIGENLPLLNARRLVSVLRTGASEYS
ncbi:hypothetical protein C8F04DRAFT_1089125 [Mycena alexandri]|uniref:F-box domain-containing protein n=1 Tax=Mycena alexandri TaxID=1745969 RepID=A0AAD6T6V3_9AGAR|nr:hypothetical protein C8F04DRAFT_1089125 [Mycena alexandri]